MTGDATSRFDLDRLIFFSDGVFAIAITLLALDLRLPAMEGPVTSPELTRAILRTAPRFLSFFISFQVIGVFWMAHHRIFSVIGRFDRGLAMLNLLLLMCIVFLPFPTTLLGEYSRLTSAATFYAGSLVVTSVASNLLLLYARRRGLLVPHVSAADLRAYTSRGLVTLALFALSIPLALVRPGLAQAAWVAVALVAPITERWARRSTARP